VRALGGSHADAVATRARVVILRGIFVTVQYCTVLYSKSKKTLLQYNILYSQETKYISFRKVYFFLLLIYFILTSITVVFVAF
jgi:hypothetical protein